MSDFADVFSPLHQERDLSGSEAGALMSFLIGGTATDSEISSVLNAMCDKGATQTEIVAFAKVMRSKATMLDHSFPDLVDTCGTGGGKPTFNISTAAAFVAAGAGVRIAKHGNRSSVGVGSADILEQLGVRLSSTNQELISQLDTIGIAFLFAQTHHPAMRHVAAARKQLGRRSFFNLLGPLVNPANARRQLIGVYDAGLLGLMGSAVTELGIEKAVLAHSLDGLDEISPCAETDAVILSNSELRSIAIKPEDFEVTRLDFSQIGPGADLDESATFFLEAISQLESPRAQAILPSASVAIWLADLEPDFPSAASRARASIVEGHALNKLQSLVELGAKK